VAEQSTFARRMMAQKLMAEKRDDPFSDSRFFAGKMRPSMDDIENPTRLSDMAGPAYGAAATGSLFVPGSGFADVFGGLANPSQPGEMLPSFGANVRQGNYLDAGLQTLGVAGDVLQAGGAFVPPLAIAGTMLKAPRAARVADAAMDAADAAKIDPNQATGAAMDAAQARYFETGKFEPPTADNPVSIVPPKPDEPGIIAFHGSGADFDEFRLEMIGTGEGAQAYGYGLYFTDSEDIARFYKDAVGGSGYKKLDYNADADASQSITDVNFKDVDGYRSYPIDKAQDLIKSALKTQRFNVEPDEKALNIFEMTFERDGALQIDMRDGTSVSFLKNLDGDELTVTPLKKAEGKMYKVGLAPKPDELLDYDAPFSAQSKDVQEKLLKAGYEVDPNTSGSGGMILDAIMSNVGREKAHLALGGKRTDARQIASQRMAEAGIPGIRYATNDTRSKQFILKLDVRGKPYDIGTEPIYARNLDDAKRIEAGYKEKGFGVQVEDIRKSNYVIFDDKAVKILEKYGIVGPVAVTAAGAAAVNRGRNDNDNGGSILPDAGVL
jgi:hypothetical protein